MLRERTNMDNAENALKVYVKPAKKEGKALYKQGEAICVMYDDDTHEWVSEKDILKMEDGDILSEISEEKLEGHNINVFGYQTQHFDYSEHAKEMFEIAILRVEESNIESKKDALANAAEHLDSILLKAKERNEIGGGLLEKQNIKILIADIQLFSYNNYKSGLEISIDLISNICSDILEFEDEFMGDKVFEYGGQISEYVIVKGYDHFNDKPLYHVISKSEDNDYVGEWHNNLEDAEEELESLKKYGGEMYGKGGEIEDSNNEMLQIQLKAVKHHAEELSNIINDNTPIEAWVVGKIERAATDLSDITHYLDGLEFEMGGEMADGGMMAKGGKLKINGEDFSYLLEFSDKELSKRLDLVRKQKNINAKQYFSAREKGESTTKIEESGNNLDNQERAIIEARIIKNKMADGGMISKGGEMKWGGRVTFKEKVEAITKSLNGRKVKPKYKKEYGNTYDKTEAHEAATKIAGAMVQKGKMSKGGELKSLEDYKKKLTNALPHSPSKKNRNSILSEISKTNDKIKSLKETK